MNVLSLFDGLSGGRVALKRAKINVNNYYSSEIDKYAIQIADKNYPMDTKHRLGDVTKLSKKQLKKLNIDLLIGGSPCQGFSMSGKMNGSSTANGIEVTSLKQYKKLKKQGFEFDGQSYLFWEFIRVLHIVKPKYFMLENVRVTKKWLPMFNEALDCEPIFINSNLVSAQNRPRYYWTNIPVKKMPKNKNILLKDILDDIEMSANVPQGFFKTFDEVSRLNKGLISDISNDKACCLSTGSTHYNKYLIHNIYGGFGETKPSVVIDETQTEYLYRKITPVECERLQTLPENYTEGVSDTQRYKMIGNGWTINVVKHIFKGLKNENANDL